MAKKHFNIKVTGRVQGVFYRSTAKNEAEKLRISGFAKNLDDSCVYIEAEGDEKKINQFIDWCHKGPLLASVESVEVMEAQVTNLKGFEII